MATVRKRVRTAANGEEKIAWVADYFDQHRTRHLKTFPTKKAAAAWLIEAQGEVARGVHTPERASLNVYEAAQLWLERGRGERLERGTLRGYDAIVRLHIGPTLGAVKLAQLTTPALTAWRDRLLAGTTQHPAVSRRLARKILGILKSILSEAQKRGSFRGSPRRRNGGEPASVASEPEAENYDCLYAVLWPGAPHRA